MDKRIAGSLVGQLESQEPLLRGSNIPYIDILAATPILPSSRFYDEIPNTQVSITENANLYHTFSLRRILRNKNAANYQLSDWKKAYEAFMSTFTSYSSDSLTRDLRANSALVGLMTRCDEPFSLLGKIETYDSNNADETLFVITRPVLVIPGVTDTKPILEWQVANTTYEKEVGVFLRHTRKIKPKEYFSH